MGVCSADHRLLSLPLLFLCEISQKTDRLWRNGDVFTFTNSLQREQRFDASRRLGVNYAFRIFVDSVLYAYLRARRQVSVRACLLARPSVRLTDRPSALRPGCVSVDEPMSLKSKKSKTKNALACRVCSLPSSECKSATAVAAAAAAAAATAVLGKLLGDNFLSLRVVPCGG